MAYEAFFKTPNNTGLQHYFPAAKVDPIEVVVEMGKTYYQVEEPQGVYFTANQFEKDGLSAVQPAPPVSQVGAVTTASLPPTQFTMLMEMVKSLCAGVMKMQRTQIDRRAPRLQDAPVRPPPSTCWGCGTDGHVRRDCLQGKRVPLNTQGLR